MSNRSVIDENPITPLQITVIAICFLLNMLDGMDVLAISFAAPLIVQDWNISPQALGIVFSAALAGMATGAVFISPLTDIIGRRNMILASASVISLGMIATAYADSVPQLIALRFVAGIGIGSMLASLTSMVSEYAPDKYRNISILILHAGYPIGAMLTGFVAAWLLPEESWRVLFVLAGVVSIIAMPLVFMLLPESLDFLSHRQPHNALTKINKILKRMGTQTLTQLPLKPLMNKETSGVKAVFTTELKKPTLHLWLAFFMSFATLYFLLSWVVKLAMESGLSLDNAMYAGVALNLGAFFGSISLGYLSSKVGLKRIISLFFYVGAAIIIIYGNLPSSVVLVLVMIFILMFFIQGAFTGLYAVAARLYPTEIRTTGVGWAIGAGRVGAIVGPAAAGLFLGNGLSISWIFIIFALPAVIAGLAIMRLHNPNIS